MMHGRRNKLAKLTKEQRWAKREKSVEKMINNWDKVKCYSCGKSISMLDAELIEDEFGEEHFVCKSEAKYYE